MLGVCCVLMEVMSTRLVCRPLVFSVRSWSGVGTIGVWAVCCCVCVVVGCLVRYTRGCGRGVGCVGILVCDWGFPGCVGSGSGASGWVGALRRGLRR